MASNVDVVRAFFAGSPANLAAERFVEEGDFVIVEAKLSGITRTGGVPLEQSVAAVYTFEDGKIRRIEEFSDPAAAYAAVRR